MYGEQAAFFEKELKPRIKHKKLGTLSMVNNGNDMHGSQVSYIFLTDPIITKWFRTTGNKSEKTVFSSDLIVKLHLCSRPAKWTGCCYERPVILFLSKVGCHKMGYGAGIYVYPRFHNVMCEINTVLHCYWLRSF